MAGSSTANGPASASKMQGEFPQVIARGDAGVADEPAGAGAVDAVAAVPQSPQKTEWV